MNEPKMTPGTVEMVSVLWIMQNATYSVDGFCDDGELDYLEMAADKGGDYCFPALVNTIMENGFRVPIVLCLDYQPLWADEPVGLTHGNGHHRMVAAILLCLDEIPVFWSATADYMCMDKSNTESLDRDNTELVSGLLAYNESPWS